MTPYESCDVKGILLRTLKKKCIFPFTRKYWAGQLLLLDIFTLQYDVVDCGKILTMWESRKKELRLFMT